LSNSDLWIVPNTSHGAHEGENKDDFCADIQSVSF